MFLKAFHSSSLDSRKQIEGTLCSVYIMGFKGQHLIARASCSNSCLDFLEKFKKKNSLVFQQSFDFVEKQIFFVKYFANVISSCVWKVEEEN
ncbi:hypothetical protein DOY81_002996 [Sarcophaga bullata]|nr:hypothetical protein DOY81_002996 [Sarcophaga bullata]